MAKLAINGGRPVRKKDFPSWPIFAEEDMPGSHLDWTYRAFNRKRGYEGYSEGNYED